MSQNYTKFTSFCYNQLEDLFTGVRRCHIAKFIFITFRRNVPLLSVSCFLKLKSVCSIYIDEAPHAITSAQTTSSTRDVIYSWRQQRLYPRMTSARMIASTDDVSTITIVIRKRHPLMTSATISSADDVSSQTLRAASCKAIKPYRDDSKLCNIMSVIIHRR